MEEGLDAVGAAGEGAFAGVDVLGLQIPFCCCFLKRWRFTHGGRRRGVRASNGVNCRRRVAGEAGLMWPAAAPPSLRAAPPVLIQEEVHQTPLVRELKAGEKGIPAGGEEQGSCRRRRGAG